MALILTSKEFRRLVMIRAEGNLNHGRMPRVTGAVWWAFNGVNYAVSLRFGSYSELYGTWRQFLAAYEFLDC